MRSSRNHARVARVSRTALAYPKWQSKPPGKLPTPYLVHVNLPVLFSIICSGIRGHISLALRHCIYKEKGLDMNYKREEVDTSRWLYASKQFRNILRFQY
jgi:hypothetical protein